MVATAVRSAHIHPMQHAASRRTVTEQAIRIWRAGVDAVGGEHATREALRESGGQPADSVLAVGKAASTMLAGALPYLAPGARGLLVTRYGHVDAPLRCQPGIDIIESGHPVPDENSLAAGDAALAFIESCGSDSRLLVLVSGGASALVEALVPGIDLGRLRTLSETLLSDGYSIDQINHIRIGISRIKGGRLLRRFPGREVRVLGLSDIPGDQAELIGSGIGAVSPPTVAPFPVPGWIRELMRSARENDTRTVRDELPFRFRSRMVGSNTMARAAAARACEGMGLVVTDCAECLNGDLEALVPVLARRIAEGGPGAYLWGGEPTVRLPENPGEGGRSQSLALALTLALGDGHSVHGVIAGTDGTDGPTRAAGGIVGPVLDRAVGRESLRAANAGPWLDRHGRLFVTGPTGTNVMDLAVLIREGG